MIQHTFRIAQAQGLECVAATGAEIARGYRAAVPLGSASPALTLDRRGYGGKQ